MLNYTHVQKDIKILEQLSEGSSSTVHRAQIGHHIVALKQFKQTSGLVQRNSEVKLLLKLDHPNICKMILCDVEYQWIAFQLYSRKTLKDLIMEVSNQNVKKIWVLKIAKAINYLHENGIVHRDIKSNNIMFRTDSKEPVLGDFGLSQSIDDPQKRYVGTQGYMAPELLIDDKDDKKLLQCDVYSFGMLIFEVFFGHLAHNFPKLSKVKFYYQQQWDEFWQRQNQSVNGALRQLIQNTLAYQGDQRWTIQQVILCEWLIVEDFDYMILMDQILL